MILSFLCKYIKFSKSEGSAPNWDYVMEVCIPLISGVLSRLDASRFSLITGVWTLARVVVLLVVGGVFLR